METRVKDGITQTFKDAVIQVKKEMVNKTQHVSLNRDNIVEEMMELFSTDDICGKDITVEFIGEEGIDCGGITRDVLSAFWEEIFQKFFDGEETIAPHKMADVENTFKVLGRIFSYGFVLTNTIPIKFCESALLSLFNEASDIPDTILVQNFMAYLNDWEKSVLMDAVSGDSSKPMSSTCRDFIMSIFMRFGMHVIPKEGDELHRQIVTMARSEFIFKPACLLSWFKAGIPTRHQQVIWEKASVADISHLYNRLKPTKENVLASIITEVDLTPKQELTLYFLKSFIVSLSTLHLERFLRYVTGSPTAPDKITVAFNNATGSARLPSSSTCSNVLVLSTSYDTLNCFKQEFLSVLTNNESFHMYKI